MARETAETVPVSPVSMLGMAEEVFLEKFYGTQWMHSQHSALHHDCCWVAFYMFACCGLVVEMQPLNC